MSVYSFATLDNPVGTQTSAYAINGAGQIVGTYVDSRNVNHGFLYIGGAYTTLDDPLGSFTVADGINASGQIVGSYQDSSVVIHGFLYSAIPTPKALTSSAKQPRCPWGIQPLHPGLITRVRSPAIT